MRVSSLAVPVALGAAAAYAAASALQHFEARRSSAGDSVALTGMLGLVRRPLWLLGSLADVAGLGLHVLALRLGPVSLVQPLQVTGLLFAIPFGGLLTGRRVRSRDLLAALSVVAGLALFLGVARPRTTDVVLSCTAAGWLGGIGVLVLGAGTVLCRALTGRRRSLLMAGLAGVGFAAGSVLLEDLGRLQHAGGWAAVVTGPGLPALLGAVVLGVVGLGLSQAAFQLGTLGQALPVLTVVDPVTAIALAALLLRETFPLTGRGVALDVLSLGLVTAGVLGLAHREDEPGSQSTTAAAATSGTGATAAAPPIRRVQPGWVALLRPSVPATGSGWRAAAVGGSYGLLPGLVAVTAMSRVDVDSSLISRAAVLLASVVICATTAFTPLLRATPRPPAAPKPASAPDCAPGPDHAPEAAPHAEPGPPA